MKRQSRGTQPMKRSRRSDKVRVLIIPTRRGLREIAIRGSRQASLVSRYSNAIKRYLVSGDTSALREFESKEIETIQGRRVPLLTDRAELDRLAAAGELSYESIYAKR
jgi:hypothetical protein